MKRLLAVVVAVVFLFGACAQDNENPPAESGQESIMEEVDLEPSIVITPVLYFLNETGTKLAAETREINVEQDAMQEMYVVQALIDGPQSESLSPVAEGFTLANIELLPDVVNVYLGLEGRKSDRDVINAKIAITSTLADFTGKKYINVFINDMQRGYMGTPTGALQKTNEDLSEEINLLQQKSDANNPTMYAVLYFLDASETLLLPEPRRLVFNQQDDGNDFISVLVEEMIRGPEDAYSHKPVLDSSLKLLNYEMVRNEDGQNIVRLNFNRELFSETDKFVDSNRMAIAALTYTITGFVPNIYGIEILTNGQQKNDTVYRNEQFKDLLGSNILLYLQSSTTSSLLVGVERIIPQEQAYLPYVILDELMKGPSATDNKDVGATMPKGITEESVRNLYIANDIMVIDMDSSVQEAMEPVSEEDEFVMIFSIVNTMTSIEGVRRVQFLVDGERVEYLGDGIIDIIDPIMKNPGIIRY